MITMKSKMDKALFGATLAFLFPSTADAYEVDCAILMCLAGGWPESAECSHARAVFIQRVTPWPVEPPLQIWRCSMDAAMKSDPSKLSDEPWHNFAYTNELMLQDGETQVRSIPSVVTGDESALATSVLLRQLAQEISVEIGKADIDVSGSEFDFVRSIKVWNVMHYSHNRFGREGECREQSDISVGTYGAQGEFRWDSSGPAPVPDWVIPSRSCEAGSHVRAVGVEWIDVEGNHGYEVVKY